MNQFSEAFSHSFTVSQTVFGEPCRVDGRPATCVVHDLEGTDTVEPGKPGRTRVAGGSVAMTAVKWRAVAGKKGSRVEIGGTTYRVINDPDAGYESDTVILQLGPLT